MKRILTVTAFAFVLVASAFTFWWWQQPDWPEFNSTNASEPQVIVRVDRDYNYHIADLITIELFVKESPGSVVDPKSVTVGGDFELNSKPEFTIRKAEDGDVIHRILMRVQTFQANPEAVLKTSIGYKQGEKRLNLTVPDQSLFWSNTYDGRKEMQQGEDSRIPPLQYFARFSVTLILAVSVFVLLCISAIRNHIANRPRPVVDLKRLRAVELILSIESDKCSKANYHELDGLFRDRFKVGPVPVSQITSGTTGGALLSFLTLSTPAIYAEAKLSDEERLALHYSAKELLKSW